MNMNVMIRTVVVATCCATFGQVAAAQQPAKPGSNARETGNAYAAYKMIKRAQELTDAGEEERGIKMLETVIEQFPKSPIRYQAYLQLGKHYAESQEHAKAIDYLRNIQQLQSTVAKLEGESKELLLESLCLTGECHFHLRQYDSAFSVLRKITNVYPDSVWASKAYYYIGMSHFAQSNWDKAARALSKVGTFIDSDSPTLTFAEAGHRFHVRIADRDLPVLHELGEKTTVTVTTKSGDKETIECKPLDSQGDVFVGSILTSPGIAKPADGTLQVIGSDAITVEYLDANTIEGKKDVPRVKTVDVVSTGGLAFTLGTFESLAPAAYLGQPLFLRLWDLDQDVSAKRDAVKIRIASLYKSDDLDAEDSNEPASTIDVDKLLRGDASDEPEKDRLVVRDEIVVSLNERGELPLRSGVFTGSATVARALGNSAVDKSDNQLIAEIGDQIVATYVDQRHIRGRSPAEVQVKLNVAGEIDSAPRAAQGVVPDPLVRSKKQLVEAEAFLELTRIFQDMGLARGAKSKAKEGLSRTEKVIRSRERLPNTLKEQAFRLKWELYLAEGDFSNAMATCQAFSRLFPESPLADQALMGIATALEKKGDRVGAVNVWRRVTGLAKSHTKAEAQFRIAKSIDASGNRAIAIREYMVCAKKYPASEFAGKSLGQIILYHTKSGAFDVADDLLEQIFVDYQDEDFLDEMLYRWIIVAFQSGDYPKAMSKYQQLITEHPGSRFAKQVTSSGTLDRIKKAMESKKGNNNDK